MVTEIIHHKGKIYILNGSIMWYQKSETSFNGADCMYPLRRESIYYRCSLFYNMDSEISHTVMRKHEVIYSHKNANLNAFNWLKKIVFFCSFSFCCDKCDN